MKRVGLAILLILLASAHLHAETEQGKSTIPNVDFQVAARRTGDQSPSNAIYLFKLYCGLGACRLEFLALNECQRSETGESAFTPRVFEWSTWAGHLQVKPVNRDTLEVTVFQGSHQACPAHLKFVYVNEMPSAKRTKAFEAKGFIDHLSPKSDNLVEFIPLLGRSIRIPLECPVLLPGLEDDKPRELDN